MPGISRTLLVQRLRHLEKNGVLDTWPSPTGRGSEYHLTAAGKDLERVIDALGRWAVEWLFDEMQPHDVPPTTLMWWMRRRVDPSAFPPQRVVIEFRHTAPVGIPWDGCTRRPFVDSSAHRGAWCSRCCSTPPLSNAGACPTA